MSYFRGSQKVAFFHPTPLNGASLLTGASCKPTPLAFFPVEKEMLFQFYQCWSYNFMGSEAKVRRHMSCCERLGLFVLMETEGKGSRAGLQVRKVLFQMALHLGIFHGVCACVPFSPLLLCSIQHFAFVRFKAERPQMLFCQDEIFKKFLLKVSLVVEMQLLLGYCRWHKITKQASSSLHI